MKNINIVSLLAILVFLLLGQNTKADINVITNGGFETAAANNSGAANWNSGANTATESVWATNTYAGSISPFEGASFLYMEGTTPASGPVTPPNCYLNSDRFSVAGGGTYAVSFYAANPVKVGGANPQYRIQWFTAAGAYISDSGFQTFASAGSSWTQFTLNPTAPANAAKTEINFIQAMGAGNGWDWVTLIDDITVTGPPPPPVTNNVTVVQSAAWQGYMAWNPRAGNDPGYGGSGGGGWGTPDLDAIFTGKILSFTPNSSITDPLTVNYWWRADGTGANDMDASMFVGDDSFVGTTIKFSGYYSNSLAQPYSNTITAFIKEFDAGYSVINSAVVNLTGSGPFNLQLISTAGAHIQYGFEMVGPNATVAQLPALGQILIASNAAALIPVTANYPTNNAPTPGRLASTVISMFNSSSVYTDVTVDNWHNAWGDSTIYSPYTITNTGAVVKKYANLNYAGVTFPTINASGMTTFHVDIWTPDADQFAIKLVSFAGGTQDPQVNITGITGKHWVGIDIPLSAFQAIKPIVLSDIEQLLFVDNNTVGGGVQNGTFYIDNIYFWTTNQVKSSIALGTQVSWTAASSLDTYQPQKSPNNSTWSNLGSALTGNAVTSAFDTTVSPFYRVLDISSAVANAVLNPSFEIPAANNSGAANWNCDPNGPYQTVMPTNSYGALTPTAGTNLMFIQGTTDAVSPAAPNAYLQSDLFPVSPNVPYALSFKAANPVKVGGANPQYRLQWFTAGNAPISDTGFISFASAGNAWTTINITNTSPVTAAQAQLMVIQAVGAGASWNWVTLVDDVKLVDSTAAPVNSTNVLAATSQPAVGITWKSGPGLTYTVQSSPSIGPATWSSLGANVIGTGTNTVSDAVTGSSKFYRVLEDY